jgi:molybdenum cofactor cytidylyltransferase
MKITTLLLAAGTATRFGGNKLLHPLPDGVLIGVASANALLAAGCEVLAITSRHDTELSGLFRRLGIDVIRCTSSRPGIGSSIAQAVEASSEADGWIIALADMPYVTAATVAAVQGLLKSGAGIVVPMYGAHRGHPVGFSRRFRSALVSLRGDIGARAIVRDHPHEVLSIVTDDPGVLIDIDTLQDVQRR